MAAAALPIFDEGDRHAELGARIEQLRRDFRLLSIGELGRRVDAVRGIASAAGLRPLAGLAAALCDALAREGRAAAIRPFLDAMREALAFPAQDEATARTFLAAVSVRAG